MYVEGSNCFGPTVQEDEFSNINPNFSIEEDLSNYNQNPSQIEAVTEMTVQQHLGINVNLCYDNIIDNINTQHFIQETNNDIPNQALPYDQDQHNNWVHEMSYNNISTQNPNQPHFIINSSIPPDLLNLLPFMNQTGNPMNFHTGLGEMSSTLTDSGSASNLVYDPLLPLNLPPHPPLFRDLFQSLPHGYALPEFRSGSLLGGLGEREVFENGDGRSYDSGILEFTRDSNCLVKKRNNGKGTSKPFATEKHRREQFNDKYKALKDLLPSPTKPDRASIVGDAIEYIKELLRTVSELKILMEKKRFGIERSKRQKIEQDGGDVESCIVKPEADDLYNNNNGGSSSLRCSWLQRKSKETEVDVRIIDDEVTIKLAQRKKINCLLIVSKVLDELQLDVHHVAGGVAGDNFSFLFSTKLGEGSCVYASAIANKLIEVVDRQYAAILSTSSF